MSQVIYEKTNKLLKPYEIQIKGVLTDDDLTRVVNELLLKSRIDEWKKFALAEDVSDNVKDAVEHYYTPRVQRLESDLSALQKGEIDA